jgi:hypothetical protein
MDEIMLRALAKKLPPIKRLVEERDRLIEEHNRSIEVCDRLRVAVAASDSTHADSPYDNKGFITARVEASDHRAAIGGQWGEVGKIQYEFLLDQGLKPEHRLLDIGCGCLRGGVHFTPYLNPGNYWRIDHNNSLIEAGWNIELSELGFQSRQPRQQLVCLEDFSLTF